MDPETPDASPALIAEQFRHSLALLRAEIHALQAELEHTRQLADRRLALLEDANHDHEARLRLAAEGVTQFKVWAGLLSGGSSLVSLAAFLKTWLLGG